MPKATIRVALILTMAHALSAPALSAGPEVTHIFPAGGQRGQTVEITAAGTLANWPVQVWGDRPGGVVSASGDKGKLNVGIDAQAMPGLYWLRLHDTEGASAPQAFIVGTIPEVLEQEPNNEPRSPQPLAAPAVVVNGRLAPAGDVDGFAVNLARGQTLVAS